jgi:hypothetical protein
MNLFMLFSYGGGYTRRFDNICVTKHGLAKKCENRDGFLNSGSSGVVSGGEPGVQ